MSSTRLPQEIILLLCEELAARRDFGTLFNCSLVSRRVAPIALEQIYSIHELSSISTGDDNNRLEWARLWRSIILSSIGETAYPYCVYVRSLSIGNLDDCLRDIHQETRVKNFFFEGPMEQFFVVRDGRPAIATIMNKCADSIIKRIKKSADSAGVIVALQHLEGTHIPHDILPGWIAQLRGLRSLRIRDGSVLGLDAAKAISQYCPNFADLTCYYCSDADEDLASFFLTLPPNSLQSFEIISKNELGPNTFMALNSHAKSLRSLSLRSITVQAKNALHRLSNCTGLETLVIENTSLYDRIDMEDYGEGVLKGIIAWISSCKSLKDLSLHVPSALHIGNGVLMTPDIRLTSLSMLRIGDMDISETENVDWGVLSSQDHLKSLTLGVLNNLNTNGLIIDQRMRLVDSICDLKNLTSLNLMLSYVTSSEVHRFAASLPNLSEFSFSGDKMDDAILESLGDLSQLKVLSINALSSFSFDGLYDFAVKLNKPDHMGIRVDILNQLGELKFKESELSHLQQYFVGTLQGRIEITYFMDPDELHETDFSDTE